MPSNKYLTVSIVIPVYNDAERLAACLQSIAQLNSPPEEVIVVDNNSSDDSVAVALSFPGVKVAHEDRQGVVYARDAGFDQAQNDLIARIDADTVLPPDWLDKVKRLFAERPDISAVSGSVDYYDFAFRDIANFLDKYSRRYLAWSLERVMFLFGANMAMRRSAWLDVRDCLCYYKGMHEDLDLGIHLQEFGHKIIYDPSLVAGLSARRLNSGSADFMRYTLVSPRTYALHKLSQRRYMYVVILMVWSLYLPARLAQRSFDPRLKRMSLRLLFFNKLQSRIDPTANVADL